VAGIPAKEIPNESSNESDGNLCKPRWHTTEFWILQAIVFGIAYVIGRQVPTAKVSHRRKTKGVNHEAVIREPSRSRLAPLSW